ncbi:MAG: hypothetical protein U5N53_02950 [Mycobacterium sp.]|nr:hypothetical protein [Mycobacterium sp.]
MTAPISAAMVNWSGDLAGHLRRLPFQAVKVQGVLGAELGEHYTTETNITA